MIVVTAGNSYVDIDAFSGCIAYAELLRLLGHDARAVLQAPLNETISKTVRSWGSEFISKYKASSDDKFVIIDLSEAKYFDNCVDIDRVVEVIDHHLGFEEYWQGRIGDKANIEFIGAAATLVYERWKSAGKQDEISQTNARLLVCGILDNTLNLKAQVTTGRDRQAYEELLKKANLPNNWPEKYFRECQDSIETNIRAALLNDSKIKSFPGFKQSIAIGQLVVWDAGELLATNQDAIKTTMQGQSRHWTVNLISLRDGVSCFIAEDVELKAWLEKLLDVRFEDSVAKAGRMWLRKEITKAANRPLS